MDNEEIIQKLQSLPFELLYEVYHSAGQLHIELEYMEELLVRVRGLLGYDDFQLLQKVSSDLHVYKTLHEKFLHAIIMPT